MTLAECTRAVESYNRVKKLQMREKAQNDYILADLIGRSVARIHSSSAKMPELNEAYPALFESEEIQEKKQQQLAELSALRFKQFAQSYNNKYREVAKAGNE